MKKVNEIKTIIDMKRTGKRLQEFARKNGYSVKDIQRYLGLACPQPVYRWYKGHILPSIDNLLRLSELFQVHMEELLVKVIPIREYEMQPGVDFDWYTDDGFAFHNRMKTYCSWFAA